MKFKDWIDKNWMSAGGLIRQTDAAKMIEKDRSRINQLIKEGRLKKYKHENLTFVSIVQIQEIVKENEEKKGCTPTETPPENQ